MLSQSIKQLLSNAIPPPDFEFDADNGGILRKGYGQMPASIRSTTGTVTDFEGLIRNCKVGELRNQGYRRVENLIGGKSEDITSVLWLKSNCSAVDSETINITTAANYNLRNNLKSSSVYTFFTRNAVIRVRFEAKRISGIGNIDVDVSDSTISTAILTSAWQTYSVIINGGLQGYGFDFVDLSFSATGTYGLRKIQVEDVTGQANQNPAEYVSVGVLPYPYHGYGADGVKYFECENGNTVTNNIVTEAKGPLIPLATRKGYVPEGQRTNLVIQSQNLSAWTAIGTPTITSANKNYGTLVLDLVGDDDAAAAEGYSRTVTFTGDAQKSISFFVKKGTATKSTIKLVDATALADRLNVEITWSGTVPVLNFVTGTQERAAELFKDDVYRIFCLTTSVTAANTNQLEVYAASDNALAITDTGNINIGGFQSENATFASGYIPTTTGTVTRNADALTYQADKNASSKSGTIYVEFTMPDTVSSDRRGLILGSGNNRVQLSANDGGLLRATFGTGSGLTWSTSTNPTTNTRKAVIKWTNNGYGYFYVDGVYIGKTSVVVSVNASTLDIGCGALGIPLYGYIKKVQIWRHEVTHQQALRLMK